MAKPNNDYNLKQNELNSKNNNNLGITSFCNFRKKGFTLIEIMAIIILLSVISIIIYPVINNTISKSEDDLYDQQIEELVRLSNAWVAGNAIDLVPKEGFTYDLTFEELATQGYIVEKDIINPKTGEVFPGCMKVTYNSVDSNYNVSYDEACEAETGDVTPIINLVVDEGVINSAGYAVRDFNVRVSGFNIASYKYCTGTRECEPIVSVNGNSGNIAITNEGITYVCVIGKKGSKTTKKLCKSYKLDKSDFVMGELVIDGTLGENGWYTSDVKLSVRDVEGVTSKLNINSITENTKGTEVILTSTSKSGKTGTKKYTVKVDKTAPVAGTLNVIGTKGGNGWYLSDVVFIVNDGSDNLSGHASTTSTHTSITSNTTGTEVIVTTKDKAGNTSTRSYVIKVNKSIPAAGELVIDGTLGENGWYTSDVNLSVKDEVGVTSTLNINKINYDTAGTEIIMTSINNLTGASKTTKYTIKVDKTKPIVGELVISGVKGDNDWYKGNVTFSVKNGSDSMSGHSKTTSSITSITKDTKGTKVVVTTKDKAGNTNTKEYIVKMDKTAPVAGTLTISGTKGSGDWYLSDVTFTINDGSDATSGHAKTTSTHTSVSGNTSGTVVTVTTTDKAGNTATRKYTIKINKDAPTAGKLVVDGTLGDNGWYVSDVKLSVNDVAGVTSTLNITKITSDTAGTEVTMTSKNNTTGAVNVTKHTIKVDKTKPTVGELVISGTKGDNGWYKSNVTFSVKNGSDSMSGHSKTTSSITSITKDTTGTRVVVTTKDKAGNTATKTYTVMVDKTAPVAGTLTISGTKGVGGWYLSDVTLKVNDGSDATSGHAKTTSTHTSVTGNTSGTKVVVTTVDNAGNIATREYTIKIDKNKPAAGTLVIDGTLGENEWYTSDVKLSVNDPTGVTSTLNMTEITGDTAGTEVVMTSKNNTTGAVNVTKYTVKIDKTKPTVGELVISGTKGDNGWYKSNVTFSVKNGSDSMSGHASTTSSISSITKDTKGTKVVVTTKDKAGNTSTKEYTVKMDKTAPIPGTLTISGTKGLGEWYLSDVTLTVNNGSDSTSGHATTTSTHTRVVGNTSGTVVTVTTKDKAGNTATRKYTIRIDKNEPTAGTLIIDGTLGENGWYTSDVKLSASDVNGVTSTLNITKITSDTKGTEVTMTSKNNTTGAVKVTKYTVKVDKTKPTIGTLVISGTKGNNGWYKSNVTFSVTNGSDSMSGHASTSSTHASITSDTKGTKVILTTKDNAGNTSTKEYTVKVDKTAPTAGTATFAGTLSNGWYTTNVSIGVMNGSDATSGHASTTSNLTSITYNTTSTMVIITTIDNAGNSSTRSYTIKVDKTTPTLTAKGSSYSIIKGVNNTVSTTYFNTPTYGISGGSISCSPPTTGSLAVGTHTLTCTAIGGNGLKKQATTSLTVKSPIYVDNSGANKPVLYNNMVPIKYEYEKWIVANTSEKWYDYDAKEWANAVVLNGGVTKNVGDEITEDEVVQWYVWIPRYKYTIFNGNNGSAKEQLIDVTFESGTNRTGTVTCSDNADRSETCTDNVYGNVTNGKSTYTHPAFKFGNTELTGFWVGKFEVSGSYEQDGYTLINIKPNVPSLRGKTVSQFFESIQYTNMQMMTGADGHMMKNMEWGAVAYLKQSKYGLGTTDIAVNRNSSYYTGGGTSDTYKTNVAQSTTGNIYGVYDMSGGAWEYVMGNMKNSSNAFYSSNAGFTTAPDAKYYDSYKYDSSSNTTHARGKLGDATKETLATFGKTWGGGWYSDYAFFPSSSFPWFARGGYYGNGTNAGVFYFNYSYGGDYYNYSARAVLSEP